MLNIHARAAVSRGLAPLGGAISRIGISPNVITVFGTVGAVASAVVFFPRGDFFIGTMAITFFVLLDILDGAVARAGDRATPFGGVLDSTGDRVADAAIFGAIGWFYAEHHERWMLLASLLCLVLGSLTSYIRSRAEAAGFNATVGIAERAERLIIVLLGTGFTGWPVHVHFILAVALWLLVAASTITVGQRLATVAKQSKAAAVSS